MFNCTIGIMAYNEEKNIGKLLDALLNQTLSLVKIKEIIVVASGCTDRTEEIVTEYARKNSCIRLLTQPKREGKASAINLFLSEVKTEIVILESADTIPEPNTIENLIKPFQNPQVGMTGGHPIPLNNTDSFIDFTNQLLWELHHQLALKHPKLGELVAFRNIVQQIPKDTITDEACIEAIITGKNYKLQYVPEAVVRNKGQANVVEFITRRRNLYAGHIQLTKRYNYAPSTMNPLYILQLIFKYLIYNFSIKNFIFTLGAILLEVWVRVLGMYDYHYKRSDLHIWKVAKGSKELEQR